MFYLKIGFRNIIKYRRRSFITMIAIIISMIACLLTHGFFNWYMSEQRESMIRQGVGHFQLYALGFSEFGNDDPYSYLVHDPESILKDLWGLPEIELVTARMRFNGILALGDKSTVVIGEAGDPRYETKLGSYQGLISGVGLIQESDEEIIVGEGVANKLSAKIGDTLTLMGTMTDGGINAVDLELSGIKRSGYSELDDTSISASLTSIQDLLYTGDGVQKLIVLLKDTSDVERISPKIQEICSKYGLEYERWETLAQFYLSLKLMFDVIFYVIILIILTVVTFTISNTINMNLNDRFRDIGTIRALGTKRRQVAMIFIIESLLLGLIGGIIGLIICCLFIGITELVGGIPLTIGGNGQPITINVFFRPEASMVILCLALFTLVAAIASIFPSRKAAALSISEALRWI